MSEEELDSAYPSIKWREPLPVTCGDSTGLACRICIADKGLKGRDVDDLPKTAEEFQQHLKAEHGYAG